MLMKVTVTKSKQHLSGSNALIWRIHRKRFCVHVHFPFLAHFLLRQRKCGLEKWSCPSICCSRSLVPIMASRCQVQVIIWINADRVHLYKCASPHINLISCYRTAVCRTTVLCVKLQSSSWKENVVVGKKHREIQILSRTIWYVAMPKAICFSRRKPTWTLQRGTIHIQSTISTKLNTGLANIHAAYEVPDTMTSLMINKYVIHNLYISITKETTWFFLFVPNL